MYRDLWLKHALFQHKWRGFINLKKKSSRLKEQPFDQRWCNRNFLVLNRTWMNKSLKKKKNSHRGRKKNPRIFSWLSLSVTSTVLFFLPPLPSKIFCSRYRLNNRTTWLWQSASGNKKRSETQQNLFFSLSSSFVLQSKHASDENKSHRKRSYAHWQMCELSVQVSGGRGLQKNFKKKSETRRAFELLSQTKKNM